MKCLFATVKRQVPYHSERLLCVQTFAAVTSDELYRNIVGPGATINVANARSMGRKL